MIGHNGPAALGDYGWIRHRRLVAHILDVIDHVVGVFLQRVIDARFKVGLGAIVIDAESAADIQIAKSRSGPDKFRIKPRRFVHRGFHLPDVGDLAAQVEVQQLEAIRHTPEFQLLQRA